MWTLDARTLLTRAKHYLQHTPPIKIAKETEAVHHITHRDIERYGKPCLEVLQQFVLQMDAAHVVVSHGAQDDLKILLREAARVKLRLPTCKLVHCTKLRFVVRPI